MLSDDITDELLASGARDEEHLAMLRALDLRLRGSFEGFDSLQAYVDRGIRGITPEMIALLADVVGLEVGADAEALVFSSTFRWKLVVIGLTLANVIAVLIQLEQVDQLLSGIDHQFVFAVYEPSDEDAAGLVWKNLKQDRMRLERCVA